MKELRTAVIGCGMISKNHLKALKNVESVQCAAVCDIELEKARAAAAEYGIERSVADYRLLLDDPEIDAVHICTPHFLHAQMVADALKAGKHVLCEKPMALSAADAEKLLDIGREAGRQMGFCFQNRYNEAVIHMKNLLEGGRLGALIGARGQVTWNRKPSYYDHSPWRGRWATEGGGVLINQAIHTFDLLSWLTCRVRTVEASISTKRLKDVIEVEDTADVLMTGPQGQRLLFYASNCYVKNAPVELEVICEKGSVKMIGNQVITDIDGEVTTEDYSSGTVLGKDYWGSGHGFLIRDFYRCVRTGQPFPVGGSEAIVSVRLLEAVYRSAKSGEPVELDY